MLALVGKLNADPRVSGILILRPIPRQVSEAQVYRTLHPLKDIEALHPENAGLLALGQPRFTPSTPASAFYLLDRYVEETRPPPEHLLQRARARARRPLEQRRQAGALARARAQRDRLLVPPVHVSGAAASRSTRVGRTSSSSRPACHASSPATWCATA